MAICGVSIKKSNFTWTGNVPSASGWSTRESCAQHTEQEYIQTTALVVNTGSIKNYNFFLKLWHNLEGKKQRRKKKERSQAIIVQFFCTELWQSAPDLPSPRRFCIDTCIMQFNEEFYTQ